ncbi:MAG: hypothetical protein QXM17_00855 [Metallosphaera sp.]
MVSEKRWDAFTWLAVVTPLVVFFTISFLLSEYLYGFQQWREVAPVILGFALFFLIAGVFLRSKFGRLAL